MLDEEGNFEPVSRSIKYMISTLIMLLRIDPRTDLFQNA